MVRMLKEVSGLTNFFGIFFAVLIFNVNRVVVKYQIKIPNLTDVIKMVMQYLQCRVRRTLLSQSTWTQNGAE